MKIIVVSDTHGESNNFYRVVEHEKTADLVVHCGDVEGQEDEFECVVQEVLNCPFVCVAGNNDFFAYLDSERELELEGLRVLVTHGHHYYVSMSPEFLRQEAGARGYQMALYGHTHKPMIETEGGIYVVNPGSLSYPRQKGHEPTYAVVNITKDGTIDAEICYLD